MRFLFVLIIICAATHMSAQTYEYRYRNDRDSTVNCYLKVMPERESIRGVIVRDYSRLPDITKKSPYQFLGLSTDAGYMTLYTVTSKHFPELYYDDSGPALLDEIINEVLAEHNLPIDAVVLGGISASGTRALRYAQYCAAGKSRYGIEPRGVFAVDSPLDLERFYLSAWRLMREHNKTPMGEEAAWMTMAFSDHNYPRPDQARSYYHKYSVYSASASNGGNAKLLKNIHVRLYHEPAIDWWLKERKCRYEDFNSIDLAGCTQAVQLMGGSKIELITSSGKGRDRNGNYNPHSWRIVDEDDLVRWIEKVMP